MNKNVKIYLYAKNLSSQCNLPAQTEQVQDKRAYSFNLLRRWAYNFPLNAWILESIAIEISNLF